MEPVGYIRSAFTVLEARTAQATDLVDQAAKLSPPERPGALAAAIRKLDDVNSLSSALAWVVPEAAAPARTAGAGLLAAHDVRAGTRAIAEVQRLIAGLPSEVATATAALEHAPTETVTRFGEALRTFA